MDPSDTESDFESSSDLGADLEPPPSPNLLPLELSSGTSTPHLKHSIGARIQAVSFLELNIPHFEITAKTGISKSQIYKLRDKAISRGWDPKVSGIVEVEHVEDTPRSGRPKIPQSVVDLILKTVTKNSTTRTWSCNRIAWEVSSTPDISSISGMTVWRVLKENGYSSYKRTVKPGLKDEDKVARLKWCLDHEHWTLEDWKNVIWTDETSVQLGSVRGKKEYGGSLMKLFILT
jgi:transposase